MFEPLKFMACLAARAPRPRTHLVRFQGLFAPNARHRRLVVPATTPAAVDAGSEPRAASDITGPRVVAALLAHTEARAVGRMEVRPRINAS